MSAPMQDPTQAQQPPAAPQAPQTPMQLPQAPGVPPMGPVTGENSAVVPVTIDQVVQLLRDDDMRGFRIDIETDQLVAADEDAEKQRAIEFTQAVGQFLGEFGPMVVQMPPLAKLASSMLTFAVRRFKTGRELEDVIEQTMDEISQKLGNPAPQPPNPEDQAKIATAQANLQIAQIRAQAESQKAQLDAQSMVQASQVDAQSKQIDMQAKQSQAELALQQAQQAHQHAMEKAAADMAAAAQMHDLEQARLHAEHERQMQLHHAKMAEMQTSSLMAVDSHELGKDKEKHSMELAEKQAKSKEAEKAEKAKPAGKRKMKIVRDDKGRMTGVEEV